MSDETNRANRQDMQVYRKVLLMVGELHRRGYERLRINPGMSPTGLHWRCSITAVGSADRARATAGADPTRHVGRYTSGQEANYFDWTDATSDSPSELADKFIERFPDLCKAGQGADKDYVEWYSELLRISEPDGFPIAYADYDLPEDRLTFVGGRREISMPLPPPPPPASDIAPPPKQG